MATILFDAFPGTGHYNGSLQLAHLLRKAGHNIVYAGSNEFKEKISRQNFGFYSLPPFIVSSYDEGAKFDYWIECFMGVFNNSRIDKALEVINEYDNVIKKVKPDLIILDSNYIQKACVYRKYGIKVICFETMVSQHYAINLPPYGSTYVPKNSRFSRIYCDFLWASHEYYIRFRFLYSRLLYLNNDSHSIYRKLAHKYGIALEKWKNIRRMNKTKVIPKDMTELILTPKSFDFPRPERQNIFYTCSPIDMDRDNTILDNRYLSIREYILDLKKKNDRTKFIFASLGTFSEANPNREKRFIKTLIEYCNSQTNHHIVLSIGRTFNIQTLSAIPDNLHIFNYIPQLDILKHCDFMITHGGMNSILECIMNEVPMIVYPLISGWDQNGNAARVVYHQIGISGNFNSISKKDLQIKVNSIIENMKYYKKNISDLNKKVRQEQINNNSVNIIEELLSINTK